MKSWKWPMRLCVGLAAEIAVAWVDNFAFEGEVRAIGDSHRILITESSRSAPLRGNPVGTEPELRCVSRGVTDFPELYSPSFQQLAPPPTPAP